MSGTAPTILRAKPDVPGADYAALRAQAIALVQAMSGEVWTDYNYSDPGVTIIEQLCYALTELPYRARLPVRDLLSAPGQARLALRRQGLFPAWSILPCNPVTVADLRRLVLDRVPGVANVWFKPLLPLVGHRTRGLYDVAIMALPEDSGRGSDDAALIERVQRCYTAHRALCEDLNEVRVLRPVPARVTARVTLEEGADPSDALAQAYFTLGLTLAPEPRRMSLQQQMAADPASTDVFSGPLMLRGFIADDSLGAMPVSFTTDQLAQALAEAPGVLAVDTLQVTLGPADAARGEATQYEGEATIPVPSGAVLRLQTAPSGDGFSITMVRRDAVCQPDAGQVRRRLAMLWRQQRETYNLRDSYAQHYGAPAGHYWDLESYVSVQTQFPVLYGIDGGLPANAAPMRRAQARQLKGYLMPFDQLLADYFSQLAFVRELFSVRAGGPKTYAWRSLRPIVADADRLLAQGYDTGMAELSAETDPVNARRTAVVDLLLSFYGLAISDDAQVVDDPRVVARQRAEQLRARQMLLRRAPMATRDRGRGLDYRRRGSERGMAGVELLSRIRLRLLDAEGETFWGDTLEADQPEAAERQGAAQVLPRDVWPSVDRHFRTVSSDEATQDRAANGEAPLDETMLAGLLRSGLDDTARYRIGRLSEEENVCLVFGDRGGSWWLIGLFASEDLAMAALRGAVRAARRYLERSHTHELYLVEWILLRHATAAEHAGGHFDFRISAVLSATADERASAGWRTQASAILRENTPAHIALDCLFLDEERMHHFRHLYGAWTQALRHGPQRTMRETSRRLASFLIAHEPPPPDDPRQDPPTPPAPPPPKPPTPKAQTPAGSGRRPHLAGLAAALRAEDAGGSTSAPSVLSAAPAPPSGAADVSDTSDRQADGPAASAGASEQPSPMATRMRGGWRPPYARGDAGPPAEAAPSSPPQATSTQPPPQAPTPAPQRSLWHRLFGTGKATATASAPTQAAPTPPASTAAVSTQPAPTQPALSSSAVRTAVAGEVGFDCDTVLTASAAAAFRAQGFGFAIRYLSRSTPKASGDLTAQEAATILAAGLALMAVQHAPAGWTPSQSLGKQCGQAAATNAVAVGLPKGVCLWLDLEGVASGVASSAVSAYCKAWFTAVTAAGYDAGLYVGASCGLTGSQLRALNCAWYWRSGSDVPNLSGTGYCMAQSIDASYVIAGVAYDRDVVQQGGGKQTLPVMAAPGAAPGAAMVSMRGLRPTLLPG